VRARVRQPAAEQPVREAAGALGGACVVVCAVRCATNEVLLQPSQGFFPLTLASYMQGRRHHATRTILQVHGGLRT
jgi:hypothetical protein